jgi:hypothetical protein
MKSIAVRVKCKIGGRKSPRSALALSDKELLELAAKPTRKRDKPMLQTLVLRRGLSLAAPATEQPEELTEA